MAIPLRSTSGPEPDAVSRIATRVPTVLVAEDDDAVRETLQRVLEHHGYRVLAVENGEAAWGILAGPHAAVDLVICDLIMPRLGGRALIQMATSLKGAPRFLVISGWSPQLGGERPDGIGDHPFLPKPWTADELLQAVKAALAN
jgi:two-component system cell cycle sensor histidine kinase/response regulator CckA